MNICEACSIGKCIKKKVKKVSEGRCNEKGEHIYVNISSVKNPSLSGKVFWVLAVDDAMAYKWSYFIDTKDQLKNTILNLDMDLKNKGIRIKKIQLDNSG